MKDKVLNIISVITKIPVDKLKDELNAEGLWDSLNKVEIIIAIEDEFDITFSKEEIASIKTIAQIFDVLGKKI